MKTLYLDIFSGIAGDMFIAALLDLGVSIDQFEHELAKLKLDGYHLHIKREERSCIAGIKFDVHLAHDHAHHSHDHHEHEHQHEHQHKHAHDHGHHHEPASEHSHTHAHEAYRTFADIRELISKSDLSTWVKEKSIAIFQRIANAEGKIHRQPAEAVHFHEVGAIDSIVDIVGSAIALELLGKPIVLASPAIEGTGWINCAHGRFPIPTPATLAILGARGIAVTQCNEPNELITPTGAAILAEFAESFGAMNQLAAEKIGYGLGTRHNKTRPNALRAVFGESLHKNQRNWGTDHIAVLETNLDDCSGEVLGNFMETALAAGALDVFTRPSK